MLTAFTKVEHDKLPQASQALTKLRHKETSPQLIEAELEEIKEAFQHENALVHGIAFFDLFRKTNLRRTLLSWGLLTGLGGSGSLMFLIYGTYASSPFLRKTVPFLT